MKLFAPNEVVNTTLSIESYKSYFANSDYIASEDLSDFFAKLKDIFNNAFNKITFAYNDKMTFDIMSKRHQVNSAIRKIKFTDIAPLFISKPENFKGFYVDYLNDLNKEFEVQLSNIFTSIEKLKYFIAYYINEYKSDLFDMNSSIDYFKKIEKQNEEMYKNISKYFKAHDESTKDEFKKLYRSLNDFSVIYKLFETLDKHNFDSNIKIIEKETQVCTELVDTLIENNIKARGKLINDEVKKNLTLATYVTAKQIEAISYLFSNLVTFYGVFNNNSKDLIEFTKRY